MPPLGIAFRQNTRPHRMPLSPPSTPEMVGVEKINLAPTNTLTWLGILLANRKDNYPPPRTLDKSWTKRKQTGIKRLYNQSRASKGIVIDEKNSDKYLKGCMKLAGALFIRSPTDPDYAEQDASALGLLFSTKTRFGIPCFLHLIVVTLTPCRTKRPLLS